METYLEARAKLFRSKNISLDTPRLQRCDSALPSNAQPTIPFHNLTLTIFLLIPSLLPCHAPPTPPPTLSLLGTNLNASGDGVPAHIRGVQGEV